MEDWKKVIWSDESPFELYATPNRDNDRVWAKTTKDVPRILSVKFPLKINVWGLMSHQALSELHIIPQGQTVKSLYYRDEILANTCRDAINRTETMGLISEQPMLGYMSDFIFMQDGSPVHTTKMTLKWCRDSLNWLWENGDWLGNSPDLNQIENLWSILKERANEKGQMTNRNQLIESAKLA
ncbi:hypothetical protein LOD99_10882 [Oopsacas minuta]|uniref:Tc1-like transposase DDE domain-containing protein n=1 Tax=Oopsacas minuta TaxID=111878 RepID=A0AAV7KCE6_9METZ|nr:hypothetical protein LOD99_10882 [Oopsacas minuta]